MWYQARSEPLGQGGVEKYFVDFCRSAKEPFSGGSGGSPPEKDLPRKPGNGYLMYFEVNLMSKNVEFLPDFFYFVKFFSIFDHFLCLYKSYCNQ